MADASNKCANTQPATKQASDDKDASKDDKSKDAKSNATDAAAASSATDAAPETSVYVCAPGADAADEFLKSIRELYGDANKEFIGPGKDLGTNSTGIFSENAEVTYTEDGVTKTLSAVDAWAAIWDGDDAVSQKAAAASLTAENWVKAVNPDVAAKIARNAQANGTYTADGDGAKDKTTWDQDGLCSEDDSALGACDTYLDCATPEEIAAYKAGVEAAKKAGSGMFFPEQSQFQAKYCSFVPGSAQGKCIAKSDATNHITLDHQNKTLNGTECRGVHSVPVGEYCDNRDDSGAWTFSASKDGVLQPFTDFNANVMLGALNPNWQFCVSALDCGIQQEGQTGEGTASFGPDCLNATYAIGTAARDEWVHNYGICGTLPKASDVNGVRPADEYEGWPLVANNATKRADFLVDGKMPALQIPCQAQKYVTSAANATKEEFIFGYEAPNVLSAFMSCNATSFNATDTNFNEYEISSIVAQAPANATYTGFDTKAYKDNVKALYELGLVFQDGTLVYANECAASSDCAVDEYCQKRVLTTENLAELQKTIGDALNTLKLPTGETGQQFLTQVAAGNTLAGQSAAVCAAVKDIKSELDIDVILSDKHKIQCGQGSSYKLNTLPSTFSAAASGCTPEEVAKWVTDRDAALKAFFFDSKTSKLTDALDMDIEGNVVSKDGSAAGAKVTMDKDHPLVIEDVAITWDSWTPRGVVLQQVEADALKSVQPGFVGAHGIFVSESTAATSNKDCLVANAKTLAAKHAPTNFNGLSYTTRTVQVYAAGSDGKLKAVEGTSSTVSACAPQLLTTASKKDGVEKAKFITTVADANHKKASPIAHINTKHGKYIGEASAAEILSLGDVETLPARNEDTPDAFATISQCFAAQNGSALKEDYLQTYKGGKTQQNCVLAQCESDVDCHVWAKDKRPAQSLTYMQKIAFYGSMSKAEKKAFATTAYTCSKDESGSYCSAEKADCSKLSCGPAEYCARVESEKSTDAAPLNIAQCKLNTQMDSATTARAWVSSIRVPKAPEDDKKKDDDKKKADDKKTDDAAKEDEN